MSIRTVVTLAFLLSACKGPIDGEPHPNDPSEQERVDRQVTSAEGDIGVLVQGHNAFSWEMHRSLAGQAGDDNLFFSPFSVTSALGMTLAGAEGVTEAEMMDALQVSGSEAAWHQALGSLTRDLSGDLGRGYTLHVANRLFGQDDHPWASDFLEVCEDVYGVPFEPWDFRSDPEGGRERVNDWVAEQTRDRIQDLLPAGSVKANTRLVLANAIYFLADWATPFDPERTRDLPFQVLSGGSVQVPMMLMDTRSLQDAEIEVGLVDGASLLRLPYKDHEVSMILVIPDEVDGLPAVEAALDGETWAEWRDQLGPAGALVGLPRLTIESEAELVPHLEGLGMGSAFSSDTADFSGMVSSEPEGALYISGVFHKAFVAIDELGTEAAAATGVVVDVDSEPEYVVADRPFLMVIQDDLTGAILFLGRVTDPIAGR